MSPGALQCPACEPAHNSPGDCPLDPPGLPLHLHNQLAFCSFICKSREAASSLPHIAYFFTLYVLIYVFICLLFHVCDMYMHGVCVVVKG